MRYFRADTWRGLSKFGYLRADSNGDGRIYQAFQAQVDRFL